MCIRDSFINAAKFKRELQSTDELIPQTSLALGPSQSPNPLPNNRHAHTKPRNSSEGRGGTCCFAAACDLISSFGLLFTFFFSFFLPPLYFVSFFSFRLNVKSRSGEECSQPSIPHNSLRLPVPSVKNPLCSHSPRCRLALPRGWQGGKVGAAISEMGSQVRRSFIPAGRAGNDAGLAFTAPSHTWPGRHSPPEPPSAQAPSHRKRAERRWEGARRGCSASSACSGQTEGAPRPPGAGISPPSFPLARLGGVTLRAQVTPCCNAREIPAPATRRCRAQPRCFACRENGSASCFIQGMGTAKHSSPTANLPQKSMQPLVAP